MAHFYFIVTALHDLVFIHYTLSRVAFIIAQFPLLTSSYMDFQLSFPIWDMFQHKGIQHFTHPTSSLCHKTTKAFISFLASLTLNNPLESHITINKIHNRPFEIHEERIQPTTSQPGILPRAAPTQSKAPSRHTNTENTQSRVSATRAGPTCVYLWRLTTPTASIRASSSTSFVARSSTNSIASTTRTSAETTICHLTPVVPPVSHTQSR